MEKWFEKYKQNPPDEDFEDLIGFTYLKKLFKSCIPNAVTDDEFLIFKHSYAFLLYGESGNGKKSLALSFAGELAKYNYSFISVCGDDFIEDSEKDTRKNIQEFFSDTENNLISKNIKNCCIFIDDIFSFTSSQFVCRAFSKAVQGIINNNSFNCIVLATVEKLTDIPMVLQKVMLPCEVGLPDEKERELCFKKILDNEIYLEPDIDYNTMARMTSEFNYGRIFKLISVMNMISKQTLIEEANDKGKTVEEYLMSQSVRLTRSMFSEIVENIRKKSVSEPVIMQMPYVINPQPIQQQADLNNIEDLKNSSQKLYNKTEIEEPKTFSEMLEALGNSDFNSII